jgi:hypothetical protein
MALWGISTTTETAANNYAIPKYKHDVDRNRSPWNTFADYRGWICRRYGTTENSGLSTTYYDEVLVPVIGLNTAGNYGSTELGATGLGTANPVAVFFEDPNKASPITVGGGGTTGITTGNTVYVHVAWNENVYCSAGSTIRVRVFDANGANETTSIIGYAASVGAANYNADLFVYTNTDGKQIVRNFNGQITNRVAFALTAPGTVQTANVPFVVTSVSTGTTVAAGGTTIYVGDTTNVSTASSVSVSTIINAPIVSVASTYVIISSGSTIAGGIVAGTAVTFSNRTSASKLYLDLPSGVVGTITDFSGGAAVFKTLTGLAYNVGGAGTSGSSVGIGTSTITVTA